MGTDAVLYARKIAMLGGRAVLLYPIVFAALPIIYLFAENQSEKIPLSEVLTPLAIVIAGTVLAAGFFFAPGCQFACNCQFAGRASVGAFEAAELFAWFFVAVEIGIVIERKFFFEPGQAIVFLDAFEEFGSGGRQIAHIVEGVGPLFLGEGAGKPVGAGFCFGKSNANTLLNQVAQRQGGAQVCKSACATGVENVLGQVAGCPVKDPEVLMGIVQNFCHSRIAHEVSYRGEVLNGLGVDQVAIGVGQSQLDNAQEGVIGLFPDKFRIQGNTWALLGALDERLQILESVDHN